VKRLLCGRRWAFAELTHRIHRLDLAEERAHPEDRPFEEAVVHW